MPRSRAELLAAATFGVYNADDPIVAAMGERHVRGIPFSATRTLEHGYSVVEHAGERWLARDARPLVATAELRLRGTHNEANALAALALSERARAGCEARVGGAEDIRRPAASLPARGRAAEACSSSDDSKGTNVGATIAALNGFPGSIVLIAGGLGKGQDFAPLAAAARGKVRAAVLIGAAAADLAAVLDRRLPRRARGKHGRGRS